MVENFSLISENERIKTELDAIKTQWLEYKYITDRQLSNLKKDKYKEIEEKRKIEEELYKNIHLLAKTNNIMVQQAQEIERVKEVNADLAHILKDYTESKKEEHSINDMLLNELKNKFRDYKIAYGLYLIPHLEFVDGDSLKNVYLTFFEDKYIINTKNATWSGLISYIKL